MKKNILSLLFVALFAPSVLLASNYEVVGGAVQSFYPESDGFTDCNIYVKNKGAAGLKLAYQKVSVDFPGSWDMSFCDNRNCFFNWRDKDTFAPLAADEKASMKVTVFPKGFSDTAIVKYAVWDINNPAQKDTLVFQIYVRWGASVGALRINDFRLGPNPAADYISLSAEGITNISVFNMKGDLVLTIKPDFAQTRIDISYLAAGQYVLMASNEREYWSRRFLKTP